MIRNRLEIKVTGLQRSGNHAIVHWIASQSAGTCIVLSDAAPGADPFATMSEFLVYHDGQVVRYVETWDMEGVKQKGRPPLVVEYRHGRAARKLETLDRASRLAVLQEVPARRDALIHTYEDAPLDSASYTERGSLFGCCEISLDVLVVRDPLNFFASRLQRWDRLSGIKEKRKLIALWKQHAREALRRTSCVSPGMISVNFARWAVDQEYRQRLAQTIGINFSDRGRDEIMPGFRSSFDGIKYKNEASKMLVNQRWRALAENPELREILSDKEVRMISDELFGPLDGWCSFVAPAP